MSRRGENIYKRKDNRWEARYIKGYLPNGKAILGYCYGKTYREAKLKQAEAKLAILTGEKEKKGKKKQLGSYCSEWLLLNRNRVRPATFVKYSGAVENHIKPGLGTYLPSQLTSVHIENFSSGLIAEGLSPKTVKDILTVLSSIIKYSRSLDPSVGQIEIVYPKVPKGEMRVLSRSEQEKFVKYLVDRQELCSFGVLLSLLTGLRVGEICALKWESVSFEKRSLKVGGTMQRLKTAGDSEEAKTTVYVSDPKTDNSAREIPLTDFAMELCEKYFCGNKKAYLLTGREDSFIEPRLLQYKLRGYTRECGLEGVHFHTLRHSFATRCVEVDFEIKSLSEILGHSSPRITLERYVHSSFRLKRDNMNKLSAIGY